ncbi:CTP-dependent riboflavin kinase [Candidatus Micrarchaeota archaeon]|nr:CTP-dependent riboflavin kinase [Candidatus Micrarchaeota archaeon]
MKKNELFLLVLLKNAPGLRGTEMSEVIGVPQQTISRWLVELQSEGLVSRDAFGYSLTVEGTAFIKSFLELKPRRKMVFSGKLVSGLGEGAYYIGLAGYSNQIKQKIGFTPFPGTLNLKLSSSKDARKNDLLRNMKGIQIDGFKEGNRFFGEATCFHAKINSEEGAVLIPKRTHHDSKVMELVFPVALRQKLKLKDGDLLKVQVEV